MKKTLAHSLMASSLVVTSLIACTRDAKDRSFKGTPAAAAPTSEIPAAGAKVDGTLTTQAIDVKASKGFIDIDSMPEAFKSLKTSLVRIIVPYPKARKQSAEQLAKSLEFDSTTVEELSKSLEALSKSEKDSGKVEEQKFQLAQLDTCLGVELKNCDIYGYDTTAVHNGFMIEGDKLITTADVLYDYIKTALVNDKEYNNLASSKEKIEYLKKDKKLNLSISNLEKVISSRGSYIVNLDSVSEKTFDLIDTDKLHDISVTENKVVLKLTKSIGIKGIPQSKVKCTDLKNSQLNLLAISSETTTDRTGKNKSNPKFGEAIANKAMLSQGMNMIISQEELNTIITDPEDQKTAAAKVIATNADAAAGFNGAEIGRAHV